MSRRAADHSDAPAPGDRTETEIRSGGRRTPAPAAATPPPPDGSGPSEAPDLPVDDPNRYELVAEKGRGGLGRVLEARDFRLGRTVAIKELLKSSPESEALFVREALVTARLQHPGVVPVHEAGRWPSGEPYYSMKMVSGSTLKEQLRNRSGLLDRLALLPNAIAVAEAIGYAHSQGIVHRDLKPANIVVGDFGETVVVDWGLARAVRDADRAADAEQPADASSTVSGRVVGTPAYMPPEQARGDTVDERADVYALGAVLYELLAGRPPYAGDSADDILEQVAAGAPPPLAAIEPEAPADLVAVVSKAMARAPADRYANAKELAEDLKRFQTGQLVTAHRYSTVSLVRRWLARHRPVVAVTGIALAVLVVLGALGLDRIVSARDLAEGRRAQAESARAAAERRAAELRLLQARSALERDPTAALAWLKDYPVRPDEIGVIRRMIDEAVSRGVARHVLPHEGWVMSLALSPDERHLATASQDGAIRLWNLETGSSRILGRHEVGATDVAFSPDGTRVASGDGIGGIVVWDVDGTDEPRRHADIPMSIEQVSFSGDGERLAFTARDGRAAVRDLVSGELALETGDAPTTAAAASPDGRTLAAARPDRLELLTDDRRRVVVPLESRLDRLAFVPGTDFLLGHAVDGAVLRFELETGSARRLGRHPGKVTWIAIAPRGDRFATVGSDPVVRVWDLEGGEPDRLRGHTDALYQAVFTADGRTLVTASDDATARVWDLDGGDARVLRGHTDDVHRVAVGDGGRLVGTASLDTTARVWRVPLDRTIDVRRPAPIALVLAVDDDRVMLYRADGLVELWTISSGAIEPLGKTAARQTPFDRDVIPAPDHGRIAVPRAGAIDVFAPDLEPATIEDLGTSTAGAFSPDGEELAHGARDGAVGIYDLRTDRRHTVAAPLTEASDARVRRLAWSPRGDRIAAARAGQLVYFDRSGGPRARLDLRRLGARSEIVGQLRVSPDGAWIAAAVVTGQLILWRPATGEHELVDLGQYNATDLAFSPDSRWLAVSLADRTIRLHPIGGGSPRRLEGHTDLIWQIRWSPDGTTLASASYDHTVRLWTPDAGMTRVLRGHDSSVDTLDFSPDGARLVTGTRDGNARVWPLARPRMRRPAELLDHLDELTTARIGADDRPITPAP